MGEKDKICRDGDLSRLWIYRVSGFIASLDLSRLWIYRVSGFIASLDLSCLLVL
ncbi:MAG: hypothetical protein KME64_38895 [Scytonematopsis contorta HA4267-MV1]|nr:hypothetical protein [Scytonematopsis contorta HA4267-MV1]